MKVAHTVELGDDARIGINIVMTGSLAPASRDVCNKWLDAAVAKPVAERKEAVAAIKRQIEDA